MNKYGNEITSSLERLQTENMYLKMILETHLPGFQVKEPHMVVTDHSTAQEKVQLFQSIFRGRTDVYATRWEMQNGKSGYSPARQRNKYIPLTDQTIYDHLSGKHVIGLYPLLANNSCWFLAVDFDKKNWQRDVLSFASICKETRIPFSIERSRSGNGAHIWIFFSHPLSASLARHLGYALMEKADNKMSAELESFDRLFPTQDHLPTAASLGNLIALPLQRYARDLGNSVFVDENFRPFEDQWLYLSCIQKVDPLAIEHYVNLLGVTGRGDKTTANPDVLRAVKKNGIHFTLADLSDSLLSQLEEVASFGNPEYFKAKAKRLSTYNIPAVIEGFDKTITHLILPRGCEQAIHELLSSKGIQPEWINERFSGSPIEVNFHGTLSSQQFDALQQLRAHDSGILAAGTGFGKTVTAAALIAEQKVNTLIIVNRKQLMNQWIDQLSLFLDIPRNEIGQFGGGKRMSTGRIDVATIQTLTSNGIDPVITQYGQVIVDECHHLSAYTYEQLMKMVRAKHVYGLTATPVRKDGLHPIITMQCGPVLYKTDAKEQALTRPFHHFILERKTSYQTASENIQQMYNEIAEDTKRNQLIFDDVLSALEEGKTPLILTERISHVKILHRLFKGFAKNIVVLSGDLTKKEQDQALEMIQDLPMEEELLIIATGKYIGEGFDFPRLDALFLTMPISWKGLLTQYVGRLHRNYSQKQEVRVYDYIDHNVPSLVQMSKKRSKGFRDLGYVSKTGGTCSSEQMKLF
ncbi:DEAD/DEAH box helicase [Sporosarcina sp. P33]|uniref:DEAD/DEAH box helicase n=1 Tax=Sporosarcina sp. P33 TaxID=1930764 RepID=UPI0009BE8AFD|nr:DEAD/DEAH box helicase [Sporosarcina sp. P33]ARD48893.1 restriction endonuclease subunit R [Sporosarcina sp. P33]